VKYGRHEVDYEVSAAPFWGSPPHRDPDPWMHESFFFQTQQTSEPQQAEGKHKTGERRLDAFATVRCEQEGSLFFWSSEAFALFFDRSRDRDRETMFSAKMRAGITSHGMYGRI
jgi:hypothetical protein